MFENIYHFKHYEKYSAYLKGEPVTGDSNGVISCETISLKSGNLDESCVEVGFEEGKLSLSFWSSSIVFDSTGFLVDKTSFSNSLILGFSEFSWRIFRILLGSVEVTFSLSKPPSASDKLFVASKSILLISLSPMKNCMKLLEPESPSGRTLRNKDLLNSHVPLEKISKFKPRWPWHLAPGRDSHWFWSRDQLRIWSLGFGKQWDLSRSCGRIHSKRN